ncbi:hypothetical protein NM688_g7462 [Phlebia brevispora]|uniref:Uncharacterized protein n=1 Tax=Phlebia brevispora TaxID=194682 RepID=A0ACC1S513_9APHY|nr:hypothetical protein NM688_g7462 [Phlebia brevispora]
MVEVATNRGTDQAYTPKAYASSNELQVPIFQTPTKSRSPSPATHTPDVSDTTSFKDSLHVIPPDATDKSNREQAHTPAIGEEKDIHQPVVGPVVVGLDSSQVLRRPVTASRSGVASPTSQYSSSSRAGSPYPTQPRTESLDHPASPSSEATPNIRNTQVSDPPPRPPRKLRTPLPVALPTPPPVQPKRDIDALKEALQLPKSVSAVLASRSNSRLGKSPNSEVMENQASDSSTSEASSPGPSSGAKRSTSIHRREGAFSPSDSSATPDTSPQIDLSEPDSVATRPRSSHSLHTLMGSIVSSEPEIVEEDPGRDRIFGWKLHRESSWVSLKHESNRASSPNGKPHASPDRRSLSSSPSPLPPPKTGKGTGTDEPWSPSVSSNPFKATLNNLKRFSALPRTPSQMSLRSAKRASANHSSRTPSPSHISSPRVTFQHRIVNAWPEAMQYRDIVALKSRQERSAAYARKIKEFTMYDSGLKDWIIATQAKKPTGFRSPRNSPAARSTTSPTLLNPSDISPIPRHVSGSSVGSEATFPIRPDAYQATDLSMRPGDDLSSTKSPPSYLPYPALAATPSRSANILSPHARTYQIPLSNGSSSRTGFFASIGRKASLKTQRGLTLSPTTAPRVLTKRLPDANNTTPRPVHVAHSPSLPGGPRAVPGRMGRSKTISVTPVAVTSEPEQQPTTLVRSETRRTSFTSRRASLFHRSTTTAHVQPTVETTSPEFEKQVDKLADLLPHADRKVLAGYLRRAGQDILAIGQYLEDEKNGTLRYD